MTDVFLFAAVCGVAVLILILDILRTHGMSDQSQKNVIGIIGLVVLVLAVFTLSVAPPRPQQPPANNAPVPDPISDPAEPSAAEADVPDFRSLISETHTPPEMLGLPADHAEVAAEAYKAFPDAFQVTSPEVAAENAKKNVRIFEITRRVALAGKPPGQDLPTIFQTAPDCAGQSAARAKSERRAVQVFKGGTSSEAAAVHPSYEYAIGRRYANIPGFPRIAPCGRGGAYPSVIALASKDWGSLPMSDAPAYNGRLSNDWSCRGIPEKYLELGKANAGGEVYPIRTVDEAIEALVNLYPLTIGVPFAPGRPYKKDGRWCIDFGTVGEGHAMAITAYDGSAGEGYFFVQNSHGERPAQAVTLPLQGEPKGGFWVTRRQMDRWLGSRGKTECWAYSDVAGFPAEDEIDWTIFGDFDVPQPQMKEAHDEDERASVRSRSFALAL